jgi:hypothetical protein
MQSTANSEDPLWFECHNINCYSKFKSERGLTRHMVRNAACQEYYNMQTLIQRSSKERCYKKETKSKAVTESSRLNPVMYNQVAVYKPYTDSYNLEQENTITNAFVFEHDIDSFSDALITDDNLHFTGEDDSDCTSSKISDHVINFAEGDHPMENANQGVINAFMERKKDEERDLVTMLQHDIEHRSVVDLLFLLEHLQAPDYALQKILEWAYKARIDGFDFNPRAVTRKANIQWIYRSLENSQQYLPQVLSVYLDDHDKPQDVVCFDFTVALLSLLQDEILMVSENLVLDNEDPFKMYWPKDNKLGEAHTGQRYRDLHRQLIRKREDLLVPIILYLDGTAIDSKGHIELCPVSFTTSLFTEKVRRNSNAWRVLGYVPDLNRGRSKSMNAAANVSPDYEKGRTTRNFHKVMDIILQGMVKAQSVEGDQRLKKVPLKINGNWMFVNIHCPLLFVINDGKQGDQLCCRFNGHHKNTKRHHRSCDCVFADLDLPDNKCNFLETQNINQACQTIGNDDELNDLSIYRVDNAFNRVQMGENPYGIFMCATLDVMHSVQHGIIMYVLQSFLDTLNDKLKSYLDRMALFFDRTCRQTTRSEFPRTDFARGITNLTQVECSERSGALFLITVLVIQEDCWHLLADSFENLEAVMGTMECLLCFEAWLDKESYWHIEEDTDNEKSEEAENAIVQLMAMITTYLPREQGHGWKVSKFHEMLHVVRLMQEFGASRGYNASRPEEHHKVHAKNPGRRSQIIADTIDQQCGRRIADTFVIDSMHTLFHKNEVFGNNIPTDIILTSNKTIERGTGTRYDVRAFIEKKTRQFCRQVVFHTQTTGPMKLENNLALFILQTYRADLNEYGIGKVLCCTEYQKEDMHGNRLISIRCHPNYRGTGHSWYDWAIVRFEDVFGICTDYPSRILSVIPRPSTSTDESIPFDLVVQCCEKRTGRESILFTEWAFNSDFYSISAEAVVGLCFVLETPDNNTVFVVKDRSAWAGLFYESASIKY